MVDRPGAADIDHAADPFAEEITQAAMRIVHAIDALCDAGAGPEVAVLFATAAGVARAAGAETVELHEALASLVARVRAARRDAGCHG